MTNMPGADLDPILQTLLQVTDGSQVAASTGSYCGEGRLPLAALEVSVQGHGQLARPLDAGQGRALHAASTPAPFGRREQTLLDTGVRDTGEIGADRVALQWQPGAQEALQAEVARVLGLPAIRLVLHSLLAYAPGQFFKPHQDTEKHDGMVGTLVLVWPSPHIGGQLQVRHGTEEHDFDSQHLQARDLRWFVFYADCQHEILPVQEGWRVVLTFDLVLSQGDEHSPSEVASPALVAALREYFLGEAGADDQPWVFLLEHEYSEHGLRWSLIKGEDRPRVAALRAAAHELGLVPRLALAELHESWTARHEGYGRRAAPEPDELINDDMVLDYWVDDDGQVMRGKSLHLSTDRVVGFSDTDETFLVDEQYEGYMGNYGDTIDYWYRRAALVLQTPHGAHASRFVVDFDAALADALKLARSGDVRTLAARLRAAADTLSRRSRDSEDSELWHSYAELAVALSDPDQAHELCRHFGWTSFVATDVASLASLERRHGSDWMQALLQVWSENDRKHGWHDTERRLWPRPLRAFVQASREQGLSAGTVQTLFACCLQTLAARDAWQARRPPAERQTGQLQRIELVCELAGALRLPDAPADLLAGLVAHIRQQAVLYPLLQLRPLLQALPDATDAPVEAHTLRAEVVGTLDLALQQSLPAADDHTLQDIAWTCRCNDCQQVIAWAESSTGTPLTLAMAQARRDHVAQQMQWAGAPLSMRTLKKGSPHQLVLYKPTDLHAHRLQQRQQWKEDLAVLRTGC